MSGIYRPDEHPSRDLQDAIDRDIAARMEKRLRECQGGFRRVTCPVLPPLTCTWPRCNCGIDLVFAPKLKNIPRR